MRYVRDRDGHEGTQRTYVPGSGRVGWVDRSLGRDVRAGCHARTHARNGGPARRVVQQEALTCVAARSGRGPGSAGSRSRRDRPARGRAGAPAPRPRGGKKLYEEATRAGRPPRADPRDAPGREARGHAATLGFPSAFAPPHVSCPDRAKVFPRDAMRCDGFRACLDCSSVRSERTWMTVTGQPSAARVRNLNDFEIITSNICHHSIARCFPRAGKLLNRPGKLRPAAPSAFR